MGAKCDDKKKRRWDSTLFNSFFRSSFRYASVGFITFPPFVVFMANSRGVVPFASVSSASPPSSPYYGFSKTDASAESTESRDYLPSATYNIVSCRSGSWASHSCPESCLVDRKSGYSNPTHAIWIFKSNPCNLNE